MSSDHVAAPPEERTLRAVIDLIRSLGNKKAAAHADAALDALLAERQRDKQRIEDLAVAVERYIAQDSEHQRRIDTRGLSAALAVEPVVPPPYHPDVSASARAAASAVREPRSIVVSDAAADPSQDRETPAPDGGAGVFVDSAAPTSPDDLGSGVTGAQPVDSDAANGPSLSGSNGDTAAAVREPAPPQPNVYLPPIIGPAPLQETPE